MAAFKREAKLLYDVGIFHVLNIIILNTSESRHYLRIYKVCQSLFLAKALIPQLVWLLEPCPLLKERKNHLDPNYVLPNTILIIVKIYNSGWKVLIITRMGYPSARLIIKFILFYKYLHVNLMGFALWYCDLPHLSVLRDW